MLLSHDPATSVRVQLPEAVRWRAESARQVSGAGVDVFGRNVCVTCPFYVLYHE